MLSSPPRAPVFVPPYGQPPYPGPPPQWVPEKEPIWKKTWFRVVAGLFVIGVIGSATDGSDKAEETGRPEASDASAAVESATPAEEAVESATPAEEAVERA